MKTILNSLNITANISVIKLANRLKALKMVPFDLDSVYFRIKLRVMGLNRAQKVYRTPDKSLFLPSEVSGGG